MVTACGAVENVSRLGRSPVTLFGPSLHIVSEAEMILSAHLPNEAEQLGRKS